MDNKTLITAMNKVEAEIRFGPEKILKSIKTEEERTELLEAIDDLEIAIVPFLGKLKRHVPKPKAKKR